METFFLGVLVMLMGATDGNNALIVIAIISTIGVVFGPVLLTVTQWFLSRRVGVLEVDNKEQKKDAIVAHTKAEIALTQQEQAKALASEMLVRAQTQLEQTRATLHATQKELHLCVEHREADHGVRVAMQRQQARTDQRLHAALLTLQEHLGIPLEAIEVEDEVDPV